MRRSRINTRGSALNILTALIFLVLCGIALAGCSYHPAKLDAWGNESETLGTIAEAASLNDPLPRIEVAGQLQGEKLP